MYSTVITTEHRCRWAIANVMGQPGIAVHKQQDTEGNPAMKPF